jgi:hypothetical protein
MPRGASYPGSSAIQGDGQVVCIDRPALVTPPTLQAPWSPPARPLWTVVTTTGVAWSLVAGLRLGW